MFAFLLNDETIPFYINCIPNLKNCTISIFFNKNHNKSLELIRTNIVHLKNNNISNFYDIDNAADLKFIDLYRKLNINTDTYVYCILNIPDGLNNNLDNIDDYINKYDIKRYNATKNTINYIYGLWDTDPMSITFKNNIKHMENTCLSCKYHVFSKTDIYSLFESNILSIINNIERKVCIADIARYVLNYNYGGYYLDLDITINKDLTSLLTDDIDILLFAEHDNCNPKFMGKREDKNYTLRIYNCIFWSVPKHSFWTDCINLCLERLNTPNIEWNDEDVIWATGPDVITTIWHQKYKNDKRIKVISKKNNSEIFIHQCFGSWRDNKDKK